MRADPEILEMIRRVTGFEGLAPAQLASLARSASLKSLAEGSLIYGEDDTSTDFFYIISGVVSIMNSIPTTGEMWTELLVLRSGSLFGTLSFLDGTRRNMAAKARERSLALEFDGAAVKKACAADPVLGMAVFATLGATASRHARDVTMELRTLIAERR